MGSQQKKMSVKIPQLCYCSSFLQIGESAGPECKAVLQEITKLVDRQLQSDRYNIKSLFGAATVFLIILFCRKILICSYWEIKVSLE